MKRIFISSVQKEFAEERRLLKRYISKNPAYRRFFDTFVFEEDVVAADQLYQVKYIEKFGTGFTDLVESCRSAGLSDPVVDDEHSGFVLTIWRKRTNLEVGITNREGSQKSSQKILSILSSEPFLSTRELAERLMISRRAVAKHIAALQMSGELRRVGPDRGGHWEVMGGK